MADNVAGQTRTRSDDQGTPGFAQGKVVLDATTIVAGDDLFFPVGFKPRYVRLQSSSGVCIEWYAGMAENSAFKAAADGARTLSASAGMKTDPRGFRVSQNATLAAVVASQTLYYVAQV